MAKTKPKKSATNPKSSAKNVGGKTNQNKQSTLAGMINSFKTKLFIKLFGMAKPSETAAQSIPFIEMRDDGICRVTERLYTKTFEFKDIN